MESLDVTPISASIYLTSFSNGNSRESWKICSKLTKKYQNDVIDVSSVFIVVFIVKIEYISLFFLCFCYWLWVDKYLLGKIVNFYVFTSSLNPVNFRFILKSASWLAVQINWLVSKWGDKWPWLGNLFHFKKTDF